MKDSTKLALLVGGTGVALLGLMVDSLYEDIATGVPSMDRFPIRGRVLLYSFLAGVEPRVIMGIIHNESRGEPANYLGDVSASGGPSIGPGQVYRATAKALKLWTPPAGTSPSDERALYADLANDEDLGVRWAVAVYKDKLRVAQGSDLLAIALYNGDPSLPQVQQYRDNALQFIGDSFNGWRPTT